MFLFLIINIYSLNSCNICQDSCRNVRNYLKLGYNNELIIENLENLCKNYPKKYQPSCINIIYNLDLIILNLNENQKSIDICINNKLCDPNH